MSSRAIADEFWNAAVVAIRRIHDFKPPNCILHQSQPDLVGVCHDLPTLDPDVLDLTRPCVAVCISSMKLSQHIAVAMSS